VDEEDENIFVEDLVLNDGLVGPIDKWIAIESEEHSVCFAKVDGEKYPFMIHTFLSVKGNRRREFFGGVGNHKAAVMGRNAKPAYE
jgi:hypothetical protein